jgi:hypothetical protein
MPLLYTYTGLWGRNMGLLNRGGLLFQQTFSRSKIKPKPRRRPLRTLLVGLATTSLLLALSGCGVGPGIGSISSSHPGPPPGSKSSESKLNNPNNSTDDSTRDQLGQSCGSKPEPLLCHGPQTWQAPFYAFDNLDNNGKGTTVQLPSGKNITIELEHVFTEVLPNGSTIKIAALSLKNETCDLVANAEVIVGGAQLVALGNESINVNVSSAGPVGAVYQTAKVMASCYYSDCSTYRIRGAQRAVGFTQQVKLIPHDGKATLGLKALYLGGPYVFRLDGVDSNGTNATAHILRYDQGCFIEQRTTFEINDTILFDLNGKTFAVTLDSINAANHNATFTIRRI